MEGNDALSNVRSQVRDAHGVSVGAVRSDTGSVLPWQSGAHAHTGETTDAAGEAEDHGGASATL